MLFAIDYTIGLTTELFRNTYLILFHWWMCSFLLCYIAMVFRVFDALYQGSVRLLSLSIAYFFITVKFKKFSLKVNRTLTMFLTGGLLVLRFACGPVSPKLS